MDDLTQASLLAFNAAPVGIVLSQHRVIRACNQTFATMLGYRPENLVNQSFRLLYRSPEEFARIRDVGMEPLKRTGVYTDERMMRHADGTLLWCRFRARSMTPKDPLAEIILSYAQLTESQDRISLTQREREVVSLMGRGMTSKEIARQLQRSPRTIEDVRSRLLKRFAVKNATELLARLTNIEN